MATTTALPLPPPFPGANRRILVGGTFIEPEKRIQTFSDEEFESFALQWANDYLKDVCGKYSSVEGAPGAGDKGRDIIAWIDPLGAEPRRWDCYQCKHYKDRLTPSDIWPELAKLCYYTHRGDYTVPNEYFIVASRGIGPTLTDFLNDPTALRAALMEAWPSKAITSMPVELTGDLRAYVEAFDFSIVKSVRPPELVQQHAQTRYHHIVFGIAVKDRPKPDKPPADIQTREARYVEQLYAAFSDRFKAPVAATSDLLDKPSRTLFHASREAFYCAESLEKFARETLPPESPYSEILDEFCDGVTPTVLDTSYVDGVQRMIRTTEQAGQLQLSGHILRDIITPKDRIGICHQLANEDRVTWVLSDE